ncbi:MAG: methylaspartate mutase accessory protein GlmL [Bacillus subtilis]|nr:methylaspartate mutase accessory protein GlmL [Bacillus subtilis]
MANYLLVDFGSTFTKLTAVSTVLRDVIGTAQHFTTVEEDIRIGYHKALNQLTDKLGTKLVFDEVIACSSAAGGLKMAAIGLVEELTVEAAKRVCLGAGAKVDLVFSHHLTKREVQQIITQKIDIVLLAGGADGGNTECVLYNCKMLGEANVKIPIIYAGNKSCQDDIQAMFDQYGLDGRIAENVMPKINQLNVKSARDQIRNLFLAKIIEAKGIKQIETEIAKVILPTPQAVLLSAELLAKGYMDEPGIGELVMVDIGGATTDLYSMSHPTRRGDVVLHGMEEPFAKRTVEGDLGMRCSATGVLKTLSEEDIQMIRKHEGVDIVYECEARHRDVAMVPVSDHDRHVDQIIARHCAHKAMARHVGKMEEIFTPLGMVFNQTGKDLTQIEWVIGTGGPVINSANPSVILRETTNKNNNPLELRPMNPGYLLDQDYIMAAMGLLSQKDPLLALQIMKRRLIRLANPEV